MKKNKIIVAILILLLVVGGAFLLAKAKKSPEPPATTLEKKALYYTCSMHPSVRSDKPGKCPLCGMELIPVYQEEKAVEKPKAETVEPEAFYGCGVQEEGHCPHCDQGMEDAQCICGKHSFMVKGVKMSCPVCGKELKKIEKEAAKELEGKAVVSRVTLKPQQVELAGIRTEPLVKRHLTKQIRTVGKVAYDPELAVAQEEFLTALETKEKVSMSPDPDVIKRAEDLLNKSKFRLRLLGMSDDEIAELEKGGKAQLNLVLPSAKAWVYADVYEYELGWVSVGQEARITSAAFAGETFEGIVRAVSPVLDPKTRAARVRIELDNPEEKLKPEMFADVILESTYMSKEGEHEVLAVPREAILDTGTRKIVYVDAGNGKFLGKEVVIGPEAAAEVGGELHKFYPVLSGLSEGELVVTKGNFLIDSQSQLTGGMSVLWGGATEVKEKPEGETAPPKTEHRH